MANTIKFNSLNAHKLSIVDLAGLSLETIVAGNAAGSALGSLGMIALNVLINADSVFRTNLVTLKASPITELISEFDDQRDNGVWEVNRSAKAAEKSSDPDKANAGKILVDFLKPYRGVAKKPLLTETSTLNFMQDQYNANPAVQAAAHTLQLTNVFANIFSANEQVLKLWNERALVEAEKSGPSPTSARNDLGKAYHNFCNIVLQTIKLQPAPELETLFLVMNEIRIKYAKYLPTRLTNANTVVAPIAIQKYTGKPVTPVPSVFIKKGNDEFSELLFTVDFYITYKNNVEIGQAQILIHGKGKYVGSNTFTFHIE
jgi:hypothetical protein